MTPPLSPDSNHASPAPSAQQLAEVVQASPCPTALVDGSSTLRWANRAWLDLLHDAADCIDRPLVDCMVLPAAQSRELLDALQRALPQFLQLSLDAHGVFRCAIAALPDGNRVLTLTPRDAPAQASGNLARLSETLDLAQEFGRLGVWRRDVRTLRGEWDRHLFRFFEQDERNGTPDFDQVMQAVLAEDREALSRVFRESLQRAGRYSHRFRVRSADGGVRHAHSQWAVLLGDDGLPDRAVGVTVDDTETWNQARSYGAALEQITLATQLAGIGTWRHEFQTARVWFSELACVLMNVAARADGFSSRDVLALIHPRDRAHHLAATDEAQRSGQPIDCELRVRRADGSWRHLLTRRVLQRDAAGKAVAMIGVGLDISDRVAAERQRTEAMHQFELSASAAGIGYWSNSGDTGSANWSARTYALHQLDARETAPLLPQWLARFVHADDYMAVSERFNDWIARGAPQLQQEFRIVRADGTQRHVVCHARLQAKPAGADLYGVIIDVHEQREAQAALRMASERIALAARGAGVATWQLDLRDGSAVWDEQMWRLRGLSPRAEAPTLAERQAMLHPDDRAAVMAELNRGIAEDRPSTVEFRVRWPDGRWRWLASRSVSMHDEQGRETRRIGVNWDITDAREAEQAREERAVAQRESQAKSQFLSRMSHELRTPLNAVLGFTQLLLADGARLDAHTLRTRLLHIESAGQHLLSLINDVLDLSSLEGGELQVLAQAVPLRPLLDETLPLVQQLARSRGVVLHVGALAETVWADPTRLRQVLLNLLSNAIKYNRADGWVRIDSEPLPGAVLLRVADSGRGMDALQLAKAFEPFNRLGAEREDIEGTGIGLPIVKALVERMGGSVQLHSTPGEGSVFEVRLPAVAAG